MRAVFKFIMLAIVAFSFIAFAQASPASDAAESSATIDGVAVQIFDESTEDYSGLVYLSPMLPTSLSAAEWARDAGDGYWYNINIGSPHYGRLLTYRDVQGITASEIRQDVLDRFPSAFLADRFTIMQVKYVAHCDCQVSLEISKSGLSPSFTDTVISSTDHAGVAFSESDNCLIYTMANSSDSTTVDPSQIQIKPDNIRGRYAADIKGAGARVAVIERDHSGASHSITGGAFDRLGNPLAGVVLTYSIDGGSNQTALTAADGSYRIAVRNESIASISGVSLDGYEFSFGGWSSGNMIGDKAGPSFTASEATSGIIVADADGNPVEGAEVRVWWLIQSGSTINRNVGDLNVIGGRTAADGSVKVTIGPKPPGDHVKAYASAMAGGSNYTFEIDDPISDVDAPLIYAGNGYLDLITYAPITLRAVEKTVEVTASGAGSGPGDSPVPYVHVEAVWMYQHSTGGLSPTYTFSDDPTDITTIPGVITPGVAKVIDVTGDYAGRMSVCYIEPVITDPGITAYLYVYGVGAANPYAAFTFDAVDRDAGFVQGTRSLMEIIAEHPGCAAAPHTTVADMHIESEQESFEVTVTITGDVPDSVSIMYYMTAGDEEIAYRSGSSISFTYVVVGGLASTVEIKDLEGYSFSRSKFTFETASTDMTFDVVASRTAAVCERDSPVVVDTYFADGVSPGDVVRVTYQIAGITVSSEYRAASSPMSIGIRGWSGNLVTGMSMEGVSGIYVGPIEGKTAMVYSIREMRYVTYTNGMDADPSVDEVVGDETVSIYVDGRLYRTFTTDHNGIAILYVPDVPGTSFQYGSWTLHARNVADGAFVGYTAFDLYDYIGIDTPTYVTVTVRYTSSSSLENSAAPMVVDIVADPFDSRFQVGVAQAVTAPRLEGFEFGGWFVAGMKMSEKPGDRYTAEFVPTQEMAGMTLVASYSPVEPEVPEDKIDNTTLVLGLVSIAVAILAFAYVILQNRRY